jgi:hypothetical protein
MKRWKPRGPIWKPWHTAPAPEDNAVVYSPEDLAGLEEAHFQRQKEMQRLAAAMTSKRRREARRAARTEENDTD